MSVFFTFLFPAFTEVTSAKKDMEKWYVRCCCYWSWCWCCIFRNQRRTVNVYEIKYKYSRNANERVPCHQLPDINLQPWADRGPPSYNYRPTYGFNKTSPSRGYNRPTWDTIIEILISLVTVRRDLDRDGVNDAKTCALFRLCPASAVGH